MTRVLIVEDEDSIRDAVTFMLRREGFEVQAVADGNAAMAAFLSEGTDLILLDLMLPGMSGTELCQTIRKTSQVPIIMLTAKDTEIDKVVGLELGADDYVTKPFSTRELTARIKAVLRRGQQETDADAGASVIAAGPIHIDVERHEVTIHGEPVNLPLKEFDLLALFARNAGRVLTRAQLIERVWGADYVGDTKTLDVHVKRLRSKVEQDPSAPQLLVTIRGLGYKFEPGPSSA